jgi:hypothetical protein
MKLVVVAEAVSLHQVLDVVEVPNLHTRIEVVVEDTAAVVLVVASALVFDKINKLSRSEFNTF